MSLFGKILAFKEGFERAAHVRESDETMIIGREGKSVVLSLEGRVLMSPARARRVADALLRWADKAEAS